MSGAEDWIVGVVIRLVGAAALNLGMVLMKASHADEAKRGASGEKQRSCLRQSKWLSGLVVLICGHLLTFASLSFASQGLVAVLGSFSLVTNVPFSAFLLKERFHAGHGASVGLLVAGSTLVVLFSSRAEQDWSESDLVDLFGGPAFLATVGAFIALFVAALLAQRRATVDATRNDALEDNELVGKQRESHRSGAESGDATHGDSPADDGGDSAGAPAAWLCAAAIGGAFSFLFAKCLSQVLRAWEKAAAGDAPGVDAAFPTAFALMSLLGVAATGGSSLWALNGALRRGRAGSVIPFYFAAHTALTMVLGVTFFKEYEALGGLEAAVLAVGVLIVTWGVIVGNAADRNGREAALRLLKPRLCSGRQPSVEGRNTTEGGSGLTEPRGHEVAVLVGPVES
mmetsp:Transcript_77390/g.187386  ORF Transcript_77390/g.187386 Transcript_77390/m.187386 type:complete len:399 (+) Transcript_77390:230-1426(+)